MSETKLNLTVFTDEQREAITCHCKIDKFGDNLHDGPTNILVSAGAGSGKTEVLAHRVAYFIEQNEDVTLDNILVLTFTEDAAKEMKKRIRELLAKIGSQEVNLIEASHISTFDSYALFLVKKYHYLFNLSSNLSIIDNSVIEIIKRQYVNEILDSYYENQDLDFIQLVEKTCYKNDDLLIKLILKLYANANLESNPTKYLKEYCSTFEKSDYLDYLNDSLLKILNDKREKLKKLVYLLPETLVKDPNAENKKTKISFQEYYVKVVNDLLKLSTLEDYKNYNYSIEFLRLPSNHDDYKIINEQFKDVYRSIINLINNYNDNYFNEETKKNKKYLQLLVDICLKLDEKVRNYKQKYQVFEFFDIQNKAIELLKTHKNVREDIRNNLKMIFIDEYQDTSILQEEFINLIANNNVFVVGDVKQSIYRFRDTTCKFFIDKYQKYQNNDGGYLIDLTDNFRSRKEIVAGFNNLFSTLMTLEYGDADYRNNHIVRAGNDKYNLYNNQKQNYEIELYNYDASDKKKDECVDIEAKIIAEDIIDKMNNHYQVYDKNLEGLRDVKYSDFCLILDRGSSFETYGRIFNDYQIPLLITKNEDIIDNDLTRVLKNLVHLLKLMENDNVDDPYFKRCFTSIARSFLFSLNDNEIYEIFQNDSFMDSTIYKKLKELLIKYQNETTFEKLKKIIYDLHVHEKLIKIGDIDKNIKYLDKFIDLFENMSLIDYDYDQFIDYLNNVNEYGLKIELKALKTDLDSVQIMNIHKSKGLGFKICYFAGYKTNFNRSDYQASKRISKKNGLIMVEDKEVNLINEIDKYNERREDVSEKIRLFYVSLTRTLEKIIIVHGCDKDKDKPIFNLIDANNFDDFLSYAINEGVNLKQTVKGVLNLKNNYQRKVVNKKQEKLNIREFEIDKKVIEIEKASKNLKIDANPKLLELGTNLHLMFEVVDFNNPDYNNIDKKYHYYLNRFLNWDVIKNDLDGIIYKEYEFYDIDENIRGIIDLMIVKDEYIDIIDYKTKNIEGIEYENQLNTYRKYIKKIFKKKVRCYLYSIVDGNVKEVIENE